MNTCEVDWPMLISDVLHHIERNLDNGITGTDIAIEYGVSLYVLKRVFRALCGIGLAQYIRERKLSEAGKEMAICKLGVLEAAIKYGYESADSFSRAFKGFHGITPSQITNVAALKILTPIQLSISKTGGSYQNLNIKTIMKKESMI